MEMTGLTTEKLIAWGGEEVFRQARSIYDAGDVFDIRFDSAARTVSGRIRNPDGSDIITSFEILKNGDVRSRCPCYENQRCGRICPHVVALGLAQTLIELETAELEAKSA